MKKNETPELIFHDALLKIPYKWAAGEYMGAFLTELKDSGRIYSSKCPACGRCSCPPRPVCGVCHTELEPREKWKPVGPKGTLLAFCVSEQSFLVPNTGDMLEVPYSIGVIMLDGAPATLQHKLQETDPGKLKPGMRVEAIFKPAAERKGDIFDIIHFKTIAE